MHGNVIVHHGVKGQRWGVRRSKKQLSRNSSSNFKSGKKYYNLDGTPRKPTAREASKEAKYLTDGELKKAPNAKSLTSRIDLERNYVNAVSKNAQRGRTAVEKYLKKKQP